MKYGQKYLASSYASTNQPSIVSSIVSYTTKWSKEVVATVGSWTRN